MMQLICLISSERIDKNVVRITALLTAATIAVYALLAMVSEIVVILLLALIAIDYFIRVFLPSKYSYMGWLGFRLARRFNLTPKQMDKAPKIFAVRVGLIFAIASIAFYFVNPIAGVSVGLALMAFNLLDGLFDICIGCYTYTYVVRPIFGE